MADLELTFATRVELDGAKAYAETLERTIGKMKAAGRDTSDLTAQLTKLNEAIGASEPVLSANETATDRATEATSKAAGEGFKYRDALKGLAFELPGVSRFLGFLANPLSLVSAGLGFGAAKLLEWKQRADEALALKAKMDSFADTVKSVARNAADLAHQAADVEKGLQRISNAGDTAATRMKLLNDEMERARQLQDRLGDLSVELQSKLMDRRTAMGTLAPEDRAAEEARIQHENARQKAARDEFDLRTRASTAAFAAKKTDDEIATVRAGMPSIDAIAKLENEANVKKGQAGLKASEFDKFIDESNKEIESLKKLREIQIKYYQGNASPAQAQEIMATADKLNRLLDEQRNRKAENEKIQRAADEATRRHDDALKPGKDLETLTQRAADLRKDADDLFRQYQAKVEFNRQTLAQEKQVSDVAVGTEKVKADQERARKDGQHWFKVYEEFEKMPPGPERDRFIDRFIKPAAPQRTATPYPTDRQMEARGFQSYNEAVAGTNYKLERAAAASAAAIEQSGQKVVGALKTLEATTTNTLKNIEQEIYNINSRAKNGRN